MHPPETPRVRHTSLDVLDLISRLAQSTPPPVDDSEDSDYQQQLLQDGGYPCDVALCDPFWNATGDGKYHSQWKIWRAAHGRRQEQRRGLNLCNIERGIRVRRRSNALQSVVLRLQQDTRVVSPVQDWIEFEDYLLVDHEEREERRLHRSPKTPKSSLHDDYERLRSRTFTKNVLPWAETILRQRLAEERVSCRTTAKRSSARSNGVGRCKSTVATMHRRTSTRERNKGKRM
jgi:hypothetical protein